MTKFIFCGHGMFGTGFKSNLETVMGVNDDLIAIDFLDTMSEKDLITQIQQVQKENEGVSLLFVCDLVGGTPFKVVVTQTQNRDDVEIVLGCNTSGLLETFLSKDSLSLAEIAQNMIQISSDNLLRFDKNATITGSAIDDDGI